MVKRFVYILFFFSIQGSLAQDFLSWRFKDRYFSVSLGTGTSTYYGELNARNRVNGRLSLLSAGLEARLLKKVGARVDVNYFTLEGADKHAGGRSFQKQRNLSFHSRNVQVQLQGIWYFKSYRGNYSRRWFFDPYLFSGVGYLYYYPTADLAGETFSLREVRTEGVSYRKWTLTIPMGVGVKFRINSLSNVQFEVSYHSTFSDYLDDVSGIYPHAYESGTAALLSDRKDEVGVIDTEFYDRIVPGSPRGDPSDEDRFLLLNLRLEWFIPADLFGRE